MAIVYRPQGYAHGDYVDFYYKNAGWEPFAEGHRLPVEKVTTFSNNFLDFVQSVERDRTPDVILVTHGNSYQGITLPIGPATDTAVGHVIYELISLVKGTTTYSEDYCSQNWGLPKEHVRALVASCRAIRSNSNVAFGLHVRGCNIGAEQDNLRAMYTLFKDESALGPPRIVTAPTCDMAYIRVNPKNAVVSNLQTFIGSHPPADRFHRRKFSVPSAPNVDAILLDLYKLGQDANSFFGLSVTFGGSVGRCERAAVECLSNRVESWQ